MLLATVFPETLEEPLPQTVEDVEKMGLSWYTFSKSSSHYSHLELFFLL